MSVLTEDVFLVKTYKYAIGNPDFKWCNTYEFFSGGPNFDDWDAVADFAEAIATAEKEFHLDIVKYDRVTVSTWVADNLRGHSYAPSNVVSIPFDLMGTRGLSGDTPLPRNIVLWARRVAEFGKSGKLYYRGVITENDSSSTSSILPVLNSTARAEFSNSLGTFYTAIETALEVAGMSEGYLAMVRPTPSGQAPYEIRRVTALTPTNLDFNKPNHKYYNQTA